MPYLNDVIVSEFRNIHDPQFSHVGTLEDGENVGTAFIKKDRYLVKFQVKISDGIIREAKFKAFSCTIVMSTTNYLCRIITGKKISEALEIKNDSIAKEFKLDGKKEKENILCEECILGAINNYVSKRNP